MVKSWMAFLISITILVLLGFVTALWIKDYPLSTVATGIVAITIGYLTKRVVQKHTTLNGTTLNGKVNNENQNL